VSNEQRHLSWLRRLRDLSHALATERNPRTVQAKILDAAVDLTEAERGFLVRLEPSAGPKPTIRVTVARGFDSTALQTSAGKVSRTIVNRVLEESRGVVTSQEEDRDLETVTSVIERRVRSVIAVPLRLRGEVVGVLYLDHRFERQAFTADDLPCLEAFADQAALAIETAELYAHREVYGRELGATLREIEALKLRKSTTSPPPEELPRFGALVGDSPTLRITFEEIERVSRCSASVLISGESGSGKELVAREIHRRSQAQRAPFVSVCCAAIPEHLAPSEFFGHLKGSFSGATTDRRGLFAQAGAGTLFLDEIGDLSMAVQALLLRALQEVAFRPVGAATPAPITCRLVVATQHDLAARVAEGRFREDLYYRLDVLRIAVPPLRAHTEDLPHLLAHFLRRETPTPPRVPPSVLARLACYRWPGNVRELENEATRLATLGVPVLSERDLSLDFAAPERGSGETLAEVERTLLEAALRESGGNKSEAARRLGIARSSFYGLLKKHGF
jgi:serine/threonine-protein kinase PknK